MMGLRNCSFVRFQNDLGTVIVNMKCPEDKDESGEGLKIRADQV